VGRHLLPLCARCTGIYGGFLLGFFYHLLFKKGNREQLALKGVTLLSIFFISALIIEGLGEKIGLWHLSNQARFLIGLFGGGSISSVFLPLFNYFLRKNIAGHTALGFRDYIVLYALLIIFFSLQYFSSAFLLFSFISVSGILAIYFVSNMTLAGMVLNWQRRSRSLKNISLLAGLVLILFAVEILILKVV
jgi:uncharacterized membrane protein